MKDPKKGSILRISSQGRGLPSLHSNYSIRLSRDYFILEPKMRKPRSPGVGKMLARQMLKNWHHKLNNRHGTRLLPN